ncbi:MAG TPA: PhzF family phenazine biosynthesis protein, partial [Actinomycetes bacterium]|nr:PhzF family phenazine biosynthesis protein [Actinomycetes bacterium]
MSWPLFQVDAFTAEPFAGNPAAVCLLERDADAGWMQRVAAEMNLSETAFLRPEPGGYGLRWFTPTVEVELCGHATLASAHVLWTEGRVPAGQPIRFDTASGPLAARAGGDGAIWLDFPATPAAAVDPPGGLLEALGAGAARWVGLGRFDYLVELEDEAAVRDLEPDVRRLGRLGSRGVIVTAAAGGPAGYDFVSRYFAPAAGIDEDPVTGSAHCTLGPFWSGRLGGDELTGFQASARGGLVRVRPQ